MDITFQGSAGQSFAAFAPPGITFRLEGDANDYFGKGLCGARLVVYPPAASSFKAEENVIVGNVSFYGATNGPSLYTGAGRRALLCAQQRGARRRRRGRRPTAASI